MNTENRRNSHSSYSRNADYSGDTYAEPAIHANGLIARSGNELQPPDRQTVPAEPPAPPRPVLTYGASSSSSPDVFWAICSEHQDRLRRQCLKLMSGNVADAEDALGDAMVRASAYFAEGHGDKITNTGAWLSRLVRNACIDLFRARSRQKRWTEEVLAMPDCNSVPSLPAPQQTPEEVAEVGEAMRSLKQKLDALPDILREPVILRFLEGHSYTEIADQLSITKCAARKRIQLARERLRQAREGSVA